MEQWNGSMGGGHCYGFSVTSLRFFLGQIQPSDFGASAVADLNIQGNEKLQREIATIVQTPTIAERIEAQGAEPVGNTPDQFSAFVKNEMVKWGKLAREIGLKPE